MKRLDKQMEAAEKRIAKFEKNIGMYESRLDKQLQKLQKEGVQLTREDFQVKPTGRWKYDYDVQLSVKAQALDWNRKYPMTENVMRAQENRDRLKDEKESLQKLMKERNGKKMGEEQKEAAVKALLENLGTELEPFRIEWKEGMMKWHEAFYERIHQALPNARVQYKELEQHIQAEQRANGYRPTARLKQLQTAKASFGRILSAPPAVHENMDSYMGMVKKMLEDMWRWTLRGLAEKLIPFDVDTTQMKVMHPRMAERGLDVLIKDNKQRVIDARMIWAAEYSEYVTPHTRYIVTERKTKEQEQKEIPDNFKDSIDMNESKPLQLQLAIQGHATRGNEVIDILKWLGGKNPHSYTGDNPKFHYEIDDFDGYLRKLVVTGKNGEYGYLGYTLEQFLEKYPYKKGDSVICNADTPKPVLHAKWENNQVLYSLDKEGLCWYSADKIKPYEKAIERTNETDCDAYPYSNTMDKGLDRLPSLKERISDVRLIKSGSGQAIRCRIDGCQQTAKRLAEKDVALANDDAQLLSLAERYFHKELADSLPQNTRIKR